MILNETFWKNALIRALKTFLQVIAGVWTAGQLITEIDWKVTLLSAVSASIYSLLMSIIGGLPEVECEQMIGAILEDDTEEEGDLYE